MSYLQGLICGLESKSFNKIKDGIVTVIDSQKRKHKIALQSADYARAIDAHRDGLLVRITYFESNLKIPVGSYLEVYPMNVGSYLPDSRLEELSNEIPGLVFEAREKGYKIKVLLHGHILEGPVPPERTNLITVYLYENSRRKNPDMYMFCEIPDPDSLIKMGIDVQEAYSASACYKGLVRRCQEIIKPPLTVSLFRRKEAL